ncbi:hypothetical protein A1F95_10519, partial [Pyrenophora tritici-repentis]
VLYNLEDSCVVHNWADRSHEFYTQFWLRNYQPRIFKDYPYLLTSAFDGASLTCLFILSLAVFGAGGPAGPFP